jgi:hypothetical protein
MTIDDGRGGHRKEGSTDYDGAVRETRHPNPGHVRSKQRPDRCADRDADAADDLRDEEQAQGTALDDGHFHGQTVAHRA